VITHGGHVVLKCKYKKKLLSQYTSLKIGGPVFRWLEPENIDDILEGISEAEANDKSLFIIGKGTNILAQDKGFDGIVINLGKGFDYIIEEDDDISLRIGSAVPIPRLVRECAKLALTGCEFLAGIPGSFGGAIFMNAGVRDIKNSEEIMEIKDIICDVDVLDLKDRKRKAIKRKGIDFGYRSSALDGKCTLGARIMVKKEKRGVINNRINSFIKRREWMRRLRFPSAGSVFKNPDSENPAGKLIEDCGLKGERIGNAEISKLHANFVVNLGGASSSDVLNLIDLARRSVKDKFGIDLELELRII
jgi:UDP-N-acetylmuramate dehydrogenase